MRMKAFIACEFGYCPLVWMLHSRKLNSRVNKLHERALRIVYQDYASSFTNFLVKDICNRNIQLLATELFKVKNGLPPPFINEIFVENAQHYYALRKKLNLREMERCTPELKLQLFWYQEFGKLYQTTLKRKQL